MIDKQIIFGGRQSGKTYTIMNEIHDLIRVGERDNILVVFPMMSYLHWWTRAWQHLFPHVPMVRYTSMQAMERVRGLRVKHVFIEDIDHDADGIYSPRLDWLYPAISGDGTITFTCSTTVLGDRSHSKSKTPAEIRKETLLKMQRAARLRKNVEEAMMIATMTAYIEKAADERKLSE